MLQDKLISDDVLVIPTIVKDINPNDIFGGSFIAALSNFNGSLFFAADNNFRGYGYGPPKMPKMWTSDGTTAGTVPFGDLSFPSGFTNVNGTLFFSGFNNNSLGRGLWKSDGTETGTIEIGRGLRLYSLTNANGTLYFVGDGKVTVLKREQFLLVILILELIHQRV